MSAAADSGSFAQGFAVRNASPQELAEALEAAFDYRGDVTLELRSGDSLVGYLFNREAAVAEPYVELYPRGSAERAVVLYRDIAAVVFSGRDAASGKSWETWVRHYETKRAARERGEEVGAIGIDADPLVDD